MRQKPKYDIVYLAWPQINGQLIEAALDEAMTNTGHSLRYETGIHDDQITAELSEYLREGIGVMIVDRNRLSELSDYARGNPSINDVPVIVIASENTEHLDQYLRCHGGSLKVAGRLYIEDQAKSESLSPLIKAIGCAECDCQGRLCPESLRNALINNGGEYIAYTPSSQPSRSDTRLGLESFLNLSRAYFKAGGSYTLA